MGQNNQKQIDQIKIALVKILELESQFKTSEMVKYVDRQTKLREERRSILENKWEKYIEEKVTGKGKNVDESFRNTYFEKRNNLSAEILFLGFLKDVLINKKICYEIW